jgi:hypothetical protein
MAENDSNPRDDVAAAYDAAVAATEAPTPTPEVQEVIATPSPVGETAEAKEARLRDEKGRFATKIGDKAPPPKVEEAPKVEVKDKAPAEPTPNPEIQKPKIAPPRSLRATTREGWDKIPREMQEDISRADKEIQKVMSESAQARQIHDKFKETISPYEHLFRSEGVEPLQGIGNLMRTTAALATGPQQTKAQIVAGIIKTYGVDIATLDALLAGQAPQGGYQQPQYQPTPDPRQFRDPRLDALLEQQSARVQQEAAESIAEVEQEEFFDDLRDNMAKLLEAGLVKTAREAYDRAALFHPDVSRVMDQRRAAANQGSTQRAQAAASSVKAQPATGIKADSDRGWYGAVEDAYEKAQGR